MWKYILLLSLLYICVCCSSETNEELRLIAFSETDRQWLHFSEVEKLMGRVKFIDITDHQNVIQSRVAVDPLPEQPQYKLYVNELIQGLSTDRLSSDLNLLTEFATRYYRSDTGSAAAKWIFAKFNEIKGSREDITVELFAHTWVQSSVIATIPGVGPHKDQVVIIGAHEDSVGSTSTGRSPGADDDGTGTVSVIEIFRVLVGAGFHPDRTLKFITYSGEEAGLLGSQAISTSFSDDKIPVHAVLQLDMTGYGGLSDIGVVTDFVDANLTGFVELLIDTYSVLTWVNTKCGYGCSDHASWTRLGYRSAFPFETDFSKYNPYIHSANDIVGHLSFPRILEFAKIGLAFAVELAERTISP